MRANALSEGLESRGLDVKYLNESHLDSSDLQLPA